MLIDREKLIEELRRWQQQIESNADMYAELVGTFVDVVIGKINAQPAALDTAVVIDAEGTKLYSDGGVRAVLRDCVGVCVDKNGQVCPKAGGCKE